MLINQGSPNQTRLATFSFWFHWNQPILTRRWCFKCSISLCKSVFLHQLSYFSYNFHVKGTPPSVFLKFNPFRVWCSIFYSKLIDCILFKIIVQHVCFVKGRGTCGSGERNVKVLIDFRKSPRYSLTSPLSQLREKSSRPVFTMCGEPCLMSSNT